MIRINGLIWAIFIVLICSARECPAAEFIPLGDFPEGTFVSTALAISPDGTSVAGAGSKLSLVSSITDAFYWSGGSALIELHPRPSMGVLDSFATGVANNGVVVGTIRHQTEPSEAFRWTQSDGLITLGSLARGRYAYTSAENVSSDGNTVVGWSYADTGTEAFYWTPALGIQGLGDLPGGIFSSAAFGVSNDGSVIVGRAHSANGAEAFRWTAATGMVGLGDLPGGSNSGLATDVSDDGSVVVGSGSLPNSGGALEAFRWTESGGFEPLGALPGPDFVSRAEAVSGDGSIVVGINGVSAWSRAFVWDASHGIRDLQEALMANFDLADELAGWNLQRAHDISSDGLAIVGDGINPNGDLEAWLVRLDRTITVPEPSSVVLLTAGMILGLSRSARRIGEEKGGKGGGKGVAALFLRTGEPFATISACRDVPALLLAAWCTTC